MAKVGLLGPPQTPSNLCLILLSQKSPRERKEAHNASREVFITSSLLPSKFI